MIEDAGGHQKNEARSVMQNEEASACTQANEALTQNPEHCMVCGLTLKYLTEAQELICSYCGKVEHGHIKCPNGHYICEICHNKDAMRIIEDIAFTAKATDPFEIAGLMMSYHGLPMLGCQHAYIASGAFMAAIKNEGSKGITNKEITEVFKRTEKQAHGGYCGLSGVCGIASAIGACFAVLTGSKCGKDEEQRLTMEAVTRVIRAITDLTGPSCCKAYVWTSLDAAVKYLKESIGIVLPSERLITCNYSGKHPHACREERCPYFLGDGHPVEAATWKVEDMCLNINEATTRAGGNVMEDKIDQLLKRSLELGAEKAKVIDTNSVVVEEWVRWKCVYGCAFYGKDTYHPPCAPDAGNTKKMMKEYSKAILLNGSKGKALTEAAVRLEGEAYHMGFYKAFAMTALSSGPEGAT
ncbi:MAG: hypothetical protein A2Z09_04440 [Nitrospirae bacterium RBG_16_43_8]|nr:MAG: hypothetical protein A2Z09_04440 [Nitrospirae bacterium RBG_16_43_8]